MMQTYTATYSPDDNKLRLYAAMRLDAETYARVRAAGFIWAAKQELFVAPMWTPDREDLLIELCGEIDDEDTSLTDRAVERSERFEDYRDKRATDAKHAESAVSAIADNIPLGQPILVGHHSERHARKDAERIENGMRRALKMWKTSEYWTDRAAGAIRHAKYKERADVRARRIKGIESDRRRQVRIRDEAAKWIRAWGKLTLPTKEHRIRDGVYAMGAPKADAETQRNRALAIANYSRVSILTDAAARTYTSVWSLLDNQQMTPREAQLRSLKAHARTIAGARRWIDHLDHRLAYERAMLAEQGGLALLAPKPKSAKAQLPLCNYQAPEGLSVGNIYYANETIHHPQITMTSAEYAAIHADYKGTRVVGHSHRVRTCMRQSSLYCVFLSDSKAHDRPAAREQALPEPPKPRTRTTERIKTEAEQRIEALRDGLKSGVQVVSAPQLFPTPTPIAQQVIALAGIRPGDRVLEPSAGTGALLAQLPTTGGPVPVAVEIDRRLAERLRVLYPLVSVQCADFLTCTEIGPFDRIVMNPPFTHGSDIAHIEHARTLLAPGGRLVAVCANGPRQQRVLKDIAREWIDLPAGSFAGAGTNVNTAIVVLDALEDSTTQNDSTRLLEEGRY